MTGSVLTVPEVFRPLRSPKPAMALSFFLSLLGVGLIVLFTGMPETATHKEGIEDELSHLLLAETFAQGRLTNPPHPLWQHFETQYVLPQPTYTSKYPPALPLLMSLGIATGGHPFLGIWLGLAIMSATVAWMLHAWLPPRWALLGASLFTLHFGITSNWTYYHSGGGIPSVIGGALLLGAMRRAMQKPSFSSGFLIGAGLLILSFGRPYEGMILGVAVAVPLAWWLFRDRRQSLAFKFTRVVTPILGLLAITAALHLIYNHAVTGNAFKLPYQQYVEHYAEVPNIMLSRPGEPPVTPHVILYNKWQAENAYFQYQRGFTGLRRATLHKLNEYWWFYIGPLLTLPLFMLLPRSWRRGWILFSMITIALVTFAVCLNFAMQFHYPAPAAPLVFFLAAVGLRTLSLRLPSSRARTGAIILVITAQLALTFAQALRFADERAHPPIWVRQRLESQAFLNNLKGDDLVIVSMDADIKPNSDIVFNEPLIDQAPIVWARSISPEMDAKLIDYFNKRRVWKLHLPANATAVILPQPWTAATPDEPVAP